MILVLLTLPSVSFASEIPSACDENVTDQDIQSTISQAEQAFANVDAEVFTAAKEKLYQSIDCLKEPISVGSAASFFRVRALDAHLQRQPEMLELNVVAMTEIDSLPPPSSVIPRGHPVRKAWEAAKAAGPGPRRLLGIPFAGRIRIDGVDTLSFPTARPSIVQFVDQDGIRWSNVMEVGQDLPEYEVAPEDRRLDYENAMLVEKKRKSLVLPVLTGVLGVASIATFGASTYTHAQFVGTIDNPQDSVSLRNTTNALAITSAGLGAVTIGLGTWTVLTW